MSNDSLARHEDHMAYLDRKLDISERMLALKEREIVLQERALDLRIAEMEQIAAHERELEQAGEALQALMTNSMSGLDTRKRGRA